MTQKSAIQTDHATTTDARPARPADHVTTTDARPAYYWCQSCHLCLDWTTDEAPPGGDAAKVEVRCVASRYCYRCIPEEAQANGLPIAQIVEHRLQNGRPV